MGPVIRFEFYIRKGSRESKYVEVETCTALKTYFTCHAFGIAEVLILFLRSYVTEHMFVILI